MVRLRAQVAAAVTSRANVLLSGPSGWELLEIAKTIHHRAHPEGDAPLVRVDGALALPDNYRRALSPDATGSALGGTLLIEAIDQMPPSHQAELLARLAQPAWQGQLLATQTFSSRDTLGNLSDELLALTATLSIAMPPLVDRPEDIPLLAHGMLEELNAKFDEQVAGFTDDALDHLVLYDWPGELAELREVVTQAHGRCRGSLIAADDLPKILHHALQQSELASLPPEPIQLDAYLLEVEGLLLGRALELARGNKAEAARLLGVSRPRLYRKLEQLGLLEPTKLKEPEPEPVADRRQPPSEKTPLPPRPDEIEFLPVEPDSPSAE